MVKRYLSPRFFRAPFLNPEHEAFFFLKSLGYLSDSDCAEKISGLNTQQLYCLLNNKNMNVDDLKKWKGQSKFTEAHRYLVNQLINDGLAPKAALEKTQDLSESAAEKMYDEIIASKPKNRS